MSADRRPLWQVISLVSIDLTKVDARNSLQPFGPGQVLPGLTVSHSARGKDFAEEHLVEVLANMVIASDDNEAKPSLRLEATYRIRYKRPAEFVPTKQELKEFAEQNGVFNAWPFWRELAVSVFSRMNLPYPPLPVYRIGGGTTSNNN